MTDFFILLPCLTVFNVISHDNTRTNEAVLEGRGLNPAFNGQSSPLLGQSGNLKARSRNNPLK